MRIPPGVSSSAPAGHASRQRRAPMQRTSYHIKSASRLKPSGLWHQGQRNGQPLKKAVVRIPGPSSVEKRCRLKSRPVVIP